MQISNKVKYGAIALGSLLIISGIYRYIMLQKKLLQDFDYKFLTFSLQNFSASDISGSLVLQFINKSDVEILVKELAFKIYVDGKYAGWVEDLEPFSLTPRGTSTVSLNFHLDPSSFITSYEDILLYTVFGGDLPIVSEGYISVKSGFISATLPIKYETSIRQMLS